MQEWIIETCSRVDHGIPYVSYRLPKEEIIRCRDCKEHEPSGICSYWSTYDADVSTGDDGFCAWAERVD